MRRLLPKSVSGTLSSPAKAIFHIRDWSTGSSSSSGLLGPAGSPGRRHQRQLSLSRYQVKRVLYCAVALALLTFFALLWQTQPLEEIDRRGGLRIPEDDLAEIPIGQSTQRDGRETFWWEDFPRLHGFYRGRRRIVPLAESTPEQFEPDVRGWISSSPVLPTVDSGLAQCYLDDAETIRPPVWSAYNGVPKGMSDPLLGSHKELGLNKDICYDRFSRYGQYGYGVSEDNGGTGRLWKGDVGVEYAANNIDWRGVKWAAAQEKCFQKNKRLARPRTAFVLRTWHTFNYTPDYILMLRAMINELSLATGGEYIVHFLIQLQKDDTPFWTDETAYRRILEASLPAEFRGMGTLWSVEQMKHIYPPPFPATIENISGGNLYDAYRSLHFPMQLFASQHPEFDYFWQWEMDMRVTGHYHELLHQISTWSESQSGAYLWERSTQFFIPSLYNDSYAQFAHTVSQAAAAGGRPPISGPQIPVKDLLPVLSQAPPAGIDEIVDLITLNPIFDPSRTRWAFRSDITGYGNQRPPTRAALITASRMSRRLLLIMHEETSINKHTMFPEMFPASLAFQYGLKAVYAPIPVYFDRQWPAEHANEVFNNAKLSDESKADGMDHGAGHFHGEGGSVFGPGEHVFRGSSYYSNANFAGYLWRRWFGHEKSNEEIEWEHKYGPGGGRMCLPMMILHPVKHD